MQVRRSVVLVLLVTFLFATVFSQNAVRGQVVMSEFSVSISPSYLSVDQGSSGRATATVTSLGDFNSPVQLDIMGLPSDVSASFNSNPVTPPAGASASSQVNFAVGTDVSAGSYPLTLMATAGESSQQDSLTLTVTSSGPPPDFEISVLPNSYSVPQGGSVEATVQVTSIGSFSSTVSLSSNGAPPGVDVVFSPSDVFVSSGASTVSTVTFTVSANVPAESYDLSLTGTSSDGGQTHSCSFELIVTSSGPPADFDLSVAPNSMSLTQGASGEATLTLIPEGDFTSTVTLSSTGAPSGIDVSFSPSEINPISSAPTSTVAITVDTAVPVGPYEIVLTGTTGLGGQSHSITLALDVTSSAPPDFDISVVPNSFSVAQGDSGETTLSVNPTSGFSSTVSLSSAGAPSGVNLRFSPNEIIVAAGSSLSSIVTVTVGLTVPSGAYEISLTGTTEAGGPTHSCTLEVIVTTSSSPDFVISLTSPSINIQQGTVGTNTLTINPVGGFFSTVYLSTNMIFPGISITFSPNQITPLPGASLTSRVSINVGSTVRAGTYSIPLLATTGSGGLSHIYTLTLIVTSSSFPDFTLTASSPALYIPQGSSGISTFTISSLSGFSSSVQLSASWLTSAPQGVTFTLPTPVTPLPNQSASSILTITTQPTSSTGSFVLRVTSSSGSLIHTADVNVQISGTSSTTTTMNPTTTVTSTTMVTTQATRDYTPTYAGIALVVIVLLGMGIFALRRKRTTN